WCSNARQQLGEFRKVFAVALGVRDRVGEAIAFVARHVVFADLVRRGVARDGAQRDLDDLAAADLAVGRQVGCFDPLLKNARDVQWYGGSATADDDAAESVRVGGGGKQHGGGPDVGADDVGVIQTEGVGDLEDEMSHRLRVHQRFAVVRSAEAGGIDGDQ